MSKTCAGCLQEIPDRRFMQCSICIKNYDLECSNVSEARFYNTMTADHKKKWKCPQCVAQRPKLTIDNTDTPIRKQASTSNVQPADTPLDATEEMQSSNVTMRKKPSYHETNSSDEDDLLPLGNTLRPSDSTSEEKSISANTINIQQFEELLKRNLKENNDSFLTQVKTIIQTEIEKSLREMKFEFKETTDKIKNEQTAIELEIKEMSQKIEKLQNKWTTLQEDTETLKKKVQEKYSKYEYTGNNDNEKTFVLHGIVYNYWETEYDLTEKISNIFHEILNTNISGYIEEISFLGKKGGNRPLKIELISKRMKKYVIGNSDCFKNTGLSVTDYYDTATLKKRWELKQALQTARKNGQHAIIKNNKLIINGRETMNINTNNKQEHIQNTQQKEENHVEGATIASASSRLENLSSPSTRTQDSPPRSNTKNNSKFKQNNCSFRQ